MMKKEKSDYVIQSVGHALDVLEAFHDNVEELGITELSKSLKLPKNKIYRILATLESHNFVEQNKIRANYRLGLKSLQLGQTFLNQTGLLQQGRAVLESLARECGETSCVSVFMGFHAICLYSIESDLPVRVVPRVDPTLPFYCTAAGKVLAAGVDEKNLREYFNSADLTEHASNTVNDPDKLTKHLRKIAKQGYAVNSEALNAGVTGVAAPIRNYTQHVIGAVSVLVPTMRCTVERMNTELMPLVKSAASEISARLGYH